MENPVILVSTDGSELSEKAIVTAAKLAKNLNTCVLGITVVKAKGSETAARTLDDVKDACQRVGVPCEVSEVVGTSIPDAILKVAQERDVRFIVMASRGWARSALSLSAVQLSRSSPRPTDRSLWYVKKRTFVKASFGTLFL